MAIMIPSFPYGFTPKSHEDEMFASLEKLPDEYYVFHSFKIADIENGLWKEKEIDFVVYSQKKGFMFIEAKAGQVKCDKGDWKYGSGGEMKDPFKQADDGRWEFLQKLTKLQEGESNPISDHCKFHMAVWFPTLTRQKADRLILPQNARRELILTREDIDNPQETIERIFSYDIMTKGHQTNISDKENKFMLDNFLCPSFNILPSKSLEIDYKKKRFDALIQDQYVLLNYLEYQRNAVINGAAGTGKTMIAVEKARRHSVKKEKVLFLCFNVKLKEYLEKAYPFDYVDYYSIDGFACSVCHEPEPNYNYLKSIFEDMLAGKEKFNYDHIIIDEGQDFGQERLHAEEIFGLMEKIILGRDKGTFYIFYDKLQLVQGNKIPEYIENADCRLTLYKNCRNTKRIAETSFKVFDDNTKPKLFDSAENGTYPYFAYVNEKNIKQNLDYTIDKLSENFDNIQILSCETSGKSMIQSYIKNDKYIRDDGLEIPFTTCRKFKGLEADAIIIIDVTKDYLLDSSKVFYVGASRAKFQLVILASLNNGDCSQLLKKMKKKIGKKDVFKTFVRAMECVSLK